MTRSGPGSGTWRAGASIPSLGDGLGRARARLLDGVAAQLERPHGALGRHAVARLLDRGNRQMVRTAVDALGLAPDDDAADIGFGGGAGLSLLLAAVGPRGQVHGCDLSDEMVARAERTFAAARADGRLTLTRDIADVPDASVDGLITVNTVYFVADLPSFLGEVRRVTRACGRIAVGIGAPDAMRSMPFTRTRFRIRDVPDIVSAAERAGLASSDVIETGAGASAALTLVFTR